MIVSERKGILTLIVWAPYILGLSVLVNDVESSNKVMFSNDVNPNPVIIVNLSGSRNARNDSAVCLFDKGNELLISIAGEFESTRQMEARERLKLRGYGTITLCRLLDESLDTFISDPETPHLVEGA